MFGISIYELFIIFFVFIIFIPVKNWADVIKFFAKITLVIKDIFNSLIQATDNLRERIEIEKPIDDLLQNTKEEIYKNIEKIPVKKKCKKNK